MTTPCPICGKDDQIQKVSSIVESGISDGTFSGPSGGVVNVDGKRGYVGGYSTLSGTSSTRLAQMMAAPKSPQKQGSCWYTAGLISWVIFLLIWVAAGISNLANNNGTSELLVLIPIGIGLLCGWVIIRKMASFSRWNREEYPGAVAEWQRQLGVYDRLYFCHRDDAVFDPTTGAHGSPKELWRMLAGR